MEPKKDSKLLIAIYVFLGLIAVLYFSMRYSYMMITFPEMTTVEWLTMAVNGFSLKELAINQTVLMYSVGAYIIFLLSRYTKALVNKRDAIGKEHGSSKWFKDYKSYNKKYVDPKDETNFVFSNEVKLNMNTHKTRKNLNVLVIGGSGTGKSRFFVKPNLLQANCSYVITDPSGELLRDEGKFLESQGYKIRVINLTKMEDSSHYNPFAYIRSDEDIYTMIGCLMKNTDNGKKGGDPFWEKAEQLLLSTYAFYLKETLPLEEQNFANVLRLITMTKMSNDDTKTAIDIMMDELEAKNPESIAVQNWKSFKSSVGSPVTAASIILTAATRLQHFGLPKVKEMTSRDDIDLSTIGDEKTALFIVMEPDSPFNYLASMMYSQLFNALYYRAAYHFGGSLPVHVRCLLDEFANVGTIPDFEKKLSTMRKFNISCSIILQSLSQLKDMYEKQWEVIMDNCDSLLFLGCQGKTTLEYINAKLGKATIRTRNTSISKGKSGSTSSSYQNQARDLLTVSEISQLNDDKCLLFIRGLQPFFNTKFTLQNHKNYKMTADFDKAFIYNAEPVVETNDEPVEKKKEYVPKKTSAKGHELYSIKDLENFLEKVEENDPDEELVFEEGSEFDTDREFIMDLSKDEM